MLSKDIVDIKGKILVLVCCAPCCCGVVEFLHKNNINATLFFYNPNIYPREEYEKRKSEVLRIADLYHIPVIDTDYTPNDYETATKGLEDCPERGARCSACFFLRLEKTAIYANQNGFDYFTSTLAVSRWKSLEQVDTVAQKVSKLQNFPYLNVNWRREGLQERAREIIEENNIYRQNYCGCIHSFKNRKV